MTEITPTAPIVFTNITPAVRKALIELSRTVSYRKLKRRVGPEEVDTLLDLIREHRRTAVTTIKVYSRDGFLPFTREYVPRVFCGVCFLKATRVGRKWFVTGGREREYQPGYGPAGPLVVIDNRPVRNTSPRTHDKEYDDDEK